MSGGWWRRSRALRALTPTLASALFLMASAPLLAQTTINLTLDVENNPISEGDTFRWRILASSAPPGSPFVSVSIDGSNRGVSQNVLGSNSGVGTGGSFFRGNFSWRDQMTVEDDEYEDDMTVILRLTESISGKNADDENTYTFGDAVTVTVVDDDISVSIAPESASVTEGGDVVFVVSVDKDPRAAFDVEVSWSGGDGFGIADGTQTVSFMEGSVRTATLTPLTTTNDDEAEDNAELTATLTAGARYTLSSEMSQATVSLVDDDSSSPDVNADNAVTANDALILYYAYSLRSDLGTGR